MADVRVTQATGEILADGDSNNRVTQATVDAIAEGDSSSRVTQAAVEVILEGEVKDSVTQVCLEVIADVVPHAPEQRVTQASLEIIGEPEVEILTPSPLTNAWVNESYSAFIIATGGLGAITFAVTAGTTPAGFSLNPATGEITGPMTETGTFNFTITATDSVGNDDVVAYALVVQGIADIAINLGIGPLGLGYTVAPCGFSGIEAHIEFCDVGLGTDTSPHTFNRSRTNFPRGLFPVDQLFYLEVVVSSIGAISTILTITNGTYSQTLTVPAGYAGRLRNSAPFEGPAGTYWAMVSAVAALNDTRFFAVHIVAPLVEAQEFVSEVRLTNANFTSTQDQTIGGGDLYRTSSPDWVQSNQPVWRYESDAWENIAAITFYLVLANASFPDQTSTRYSQVALVDIDDPGEFGFTRMISTQNINIFLTPTQFSFVLNPTTLRDNHRYQIWVRSVKPTGANSFNTYLHTARLQLAMAPANRAEIYNRCGSNKRVYLSGFMMPEPEIYFQIQSAGVETRKLSDMGASTPGGNTTVTGTELAATSVTSAAHDSIRTAEISALLTAGHDFQAPCTLQCELVYRFSDVIRLCQHNYMF